MNTENKSKWQIRLATFAIFILGLLAGGLALNAYQVLVSSASSKAPKPYDEMLYKLDLTDSQRTEVQQIVGETREQVQKVRGESEQRFDEIRGRADQKLQQVLTPEQYRKFQEMKSNWRDSNKRRPKNS